MTSGVTDISVSPQLHRSDDGKPADFENEDVFQINRLKPRAYWIPETSISLNGEWDFHYARNPLQAPDPTGVNSDANSRSSWPTSNLSLEDQTAAPDWTKIAVPGHWQLQGFGRPQYTNVIYPFPVCPPDVPSENPTGTYRRYFSVPDEWDSESQIRLRFEGVDSAYHVFVDGHFVGYHQGSRNPGEFDITSFVRRGSRSELLVRVYQWSDGSYIEDQDQWWLSGIFRDVYLLAFPTSHIEDFHVKTTFDKDFIDAILEVSLDVHRDGKEDIYTDYQLDDKTAGEKNVSSGTYAVEHSSIHFKSNIKRPKHWTAETPYLYELTINLRKSSSTEPFQTIRQKVGFRQVEIKDGHLLVNGRHIILQGVNRHDHHPELGRAVPLSFIRKDLILMKQHNVNALRCSHYPPNPKMLEMCNELGLWVMDEADLECHGFYDAVARPLDIPESMDYDQRKRLAFPQAAEFTSNNPRWGKQYVDRMESVVQRDKNHPSVIIWSLGNEAFYGQNHKSMYDYVKQVDLTRPVHYEGDAKAASADMFSYMYPSTKKLVELSKTQGMTDGKYDKPIVLCEYAHAMGNGPGNLKGYQDVFQSNPRTQGGFIWEWANHGLLKNKGDHEKQFYAYGGDFNDFPNDGTFVMDGLCFSDHTPTPGLTEYKKIIAPIVASFRSVETSNKPSELELYIENRHDFADINHVVANINVESLQDGHRTLLHSDVLDLPHIPARKTGSVVISAQKLGPVTNANTWITVSFQTKISTPWAEAGHEVAWVQHSLNELREHPDPSTTKLETSSELQVKTSKGFWTIGNGSFEITFDRSLGGLKSWISAGQEMVVCDDQHLTAISPGFWRAPTDNDMPRNSPYWKNFGVDAMTTQLRATSLERSPTGEVRVKSRLFISPPILDWGFETEIVYHITPDERLGVEVSLQPSGRQPDYLPRVGLEIRLANSFSVAKYLGFGPGESYPDKQDAQRIGIYESAVQDLRTNYEVPQESGNRMAAQYVKLFDNKASRCIEATRPGNQFSWAVDCFSVQDIEAAKHPCDLNEANAHTLRLDAEVAGVGSGACGPDVLDEHKVKCVPFKFSFELHSTVDSL